MDNLSIIHVDMDAFFASVEQRDDPQLRNKPVIIGGHPHQRGVVSTCSYEARRFGVHSAMPLGEAYRRCPQGIFMRGNMQKYHEVSQQIHAIFCRFTPLVEPLSIDEAFLDVSGCERLFGSGLEIGHLIKQQIQDEIQLTASVGVSYNKFLAKLASDYKKPDGFMVIEQDQAKAFLAPLPITRLWGVGEKTAAYLQTLGVRQIGQLAAFPLADLRRHLGVMADQLHSLALGVDHRHVEPPQQAKSIGHEYTFDEDTFNQDLVITALLELTGKVGRRLRQADLAGRTITLKLRYGDFSTTTRSCSSPQATCYDQEIFQAAKFLLTPQLKLDKPIRLIGVSVSHLCSADQIYQQLSLLQEPDDDERRSRLTKAMDQIKNRFGEGSISWARVALDFDGEIPPES